MHLKTIKLRGFKSFVDPLEVRLEPGVAVVIGPNGSGKSNISDSILWATGSLSPHELRAEKPDDVLFAGSSTRKPVDFCEVELLFDNADGSWPDLPFSEVSVARRLHRGGEGQYLVNHAAVRRIDLVELLSDVGLGGGLRSVISQGSVESVLGAKPYERRELVEEAAGLGRFKRRRHRAELKLARVGTQVERARDVEAEVRKRLRPLALQATAAERAAKLGEELAGLNAAIATLDLTRLAGRREASESQRTSELAQRTELEARIAALIASRERAEEELTDTAGTREGATAALYRLRSATERLELRREAAQAVHASLAAEHRAAVEFDPTRSDELVGAARAATAAAQEAARERARLEFEVEELSARVAGAERARLAVLEAELQELVRGRGELEADLASGGSTALLALRDLSSRLRVRQESVQRLRDDLRGELEEARRELPAGPTPAELGREADEADEAARAALRERDDLTARATLAQERLAALEQSLAEREGLPPAARALAEQGERLALSTLDVEPGDERAVAAALGRLASAIVADDPERGLALLEKARELGLGSLVVLVGRDAGELVAALPVVEPDALLASPIAAVTRDGIGWDPARGELWFAGETAEAVLLELEAQRHRLADEAQALSGSAGRATVQAAAAVERSQTAAAAFAPVAHLRGVRRKDPRILDRLVLAAGRLDAALEAAVVRAASLEGPLAQRAASAAETLRDLGTREAVLRAAVSAHSGLALAAERGANGRTSTHGDGDADALRAQADGIAVQVAAATEAARVAADRAAAASRALAEAEGRGSPRIGAMLLERLAGCAERLIAALTVDTARFEAPLRERVDAGAARTAELGNELRRLGGEEVELRTDATALSERVAAIDVDLARIDAERDEAARRLEAAGAEPADGDNRDELAARVERLERRREQLGQVNPLAREEYEAEKERLDELATQRADLERSLEELEQLRRDLTETVERRFAETFEAVEKHFAEVAGSLFPGGEGRLRLTEPEEEGEEPGIEVELRPVGKRVTRLSLLSGGEKALGAIAFLFSLFLARPSPFYLLDEVEAALDDTNIGRFTSLLRQYADQAQFIVVTHQKRTMEAADVLYGVTMRGDGVSQLVSRRLPQDDEAAATA